MFVNMFVHEITKQRFNFGDLEIIFVDHVVNLKQNNFQTIADISLDFVFSFGLVIITARHATLIAPQGLNLFL